DFEDHPDPVAVGAAEIEDNDIGLGIPQQVKEPVFERDRFTAGLGRFFPAGDGEVFAGNYNGRSSRVHSGSALLIRTGKDGGIEPFLTDTSFIAQLCSGDGKVIITVRGFSKRVSEVPVCSIVA